MTWPFLRIDVEGEGVQIELYSITWCFIGFRSTIHFEKNDRRTHYQLGLSLEIGVDIPEASLLGDSVRDR